MFLVYSIYSIWFALLGLFYLFPCESDFFGEKADCGSHNLDAAGRKPLQAFALIECSTHHPTRFHAGRDAS
ncbi:uncharacterized protein B0H64DRAFT_392182 [Chaetomium fimeti]|uniref:Secreted protein n=1 Tax=Chaetomium fimeti TaxID=1854472 RepID=A0AAE0HJJ9_9PEZI|nr:hypothetical protein B0H64DRAFT_392182 [Chaetomium fimeti]